MKLILNELNTIFVISKIFINLIYESLIFKIHKKKNMFVGKLFVVKFYLRKMKGENFSFRYREYSVW